MFYYADLAGLLQIWSDSAICPSHARYGMSSRKYIYCVPVTIWEEDCPVSPYHLYAEQYKDRIYIQITIDFRMVKKDGIKSYLTSEGFVAIDCQFLGNLYVKAVLGMRTGQFWYIRQFKISDEFWRRGASVEDKEDTRNERSVVDETCFVCNSLMWLGTVTCFHCSSPFMYVNVFPEFDPDASCALDGEYLVRLEDDLLRKLMKGIASGRKAVGMQFNVIYGIRFPSKEIEKKKAAVFNRSLAKQAERHDRHWQRQNARDLLLGVTRANTIEERIQTDKVLRLRLARKVANCSTNFAPGQILLSEVCRLAFRVAIELGEMSYENLGYRARAQVVNVAEQN